MFNAYIVCLKMATETDLINAMREALDKDGVLQRIQAELRYKIIKILDTPAEDREEVNIPHSVLLTNELIREYLDWIGYKYTLSVLVSESKLGNRPLHRQFLVDSLGVNDNDEKTKKVPLLYCIIQTFKNLKKNTVNK